MKKATFIKYIAFFSALCAVLLGIAGCAMDELQVAGKPQVSKDTGVLSLSIKGINANSRTIVPNIEYERIVVKIITELEGSEVDLGRIYDITNTNFELIKG